MNVRVLCFLLMLSSAFLCAGCQTSPKNAVPNKLRSTLHSAELRYQAGDLQAAAELYREAVVMQPRLADVYLRLGVIAYRRNELTSAEQYFKQVLRIEPRNERALFDLSLLRMQQARELVEQFLAVSSTRSARRSEAEVLAEQLEKISTAD